MWRRHKNESKDEILRRLNLSVGAITHFAVSKQKYKSIEISKFLFVFQLSLHFKTSFS